MSQPGLFITFEGIEGSGKTTQIRLLSEALKEKGYSVCMTREPGGTEIGKHIRELVLNSPVPFEHPQTELMLFCADRFEHVARIIMPALNRGEIVLCDRYIDSTIAYQMGGRQLPLAWRAWVESDTLPMPERTFLMDLPAEVGVSRAQSRGDANRFEFEEIAFHQRVRDMYLYLAKEQSNRIQTLLVAAFEPEVIAAQVWQGISEILAIKKGQLHD